MNSRRSRSFVLALTLVMTSAGFAVPSRDDAAPTLRPDDLRCEYLVNPRGIDARSPRLSWTLRALQDGCRGPGRHRTAYQVVVGPFGKPRSASRKISSGIPERWRRTNRSGCLTRAGRWSRMPLAGGWSGSGTRAGRLPSGACPPPGRWGFSIPRTGRPAGSAGTSRTRPARIRLICSSKPPGSGSPAGNPPSGRQSAPDTSDGRWTFPKDVGSARPSGSGPPTMRSSRSSTGRRWGAAKAGPSFSSST